jgi:hypothetical protein
VPEASANVHGDLGRTEHDVHTAPSPRHDRAVNAVPQPTPMEFSAQCQFQASVLLGLRSHRTALGRRWFVARRRHGAIMADMRGDAQSDEALDAVEAWWREQPRYAERLGWCVRTSIDEVIDTARTGRYSIDQLNSQEKAYIGTKVETVIRGEFDLAYPGPKGKDYLVAGYEVDCKWSIHWGGWEIPTEQRGHLCLLVHANDNKHDLAVGLMRTLPEYINPGKNKDSKSSIKAAARDAHARWLIPRGPDLPTNFLLHLPRADRTAILQTHRGGVDRAFELYRRCEGVIISRHVMESVGQQRDEARRFRGGAGGVRDLLDHHGFEVLNGTWIADRERAAALGGPVPRTGESVCLHRDGKSAERARTRGTAAVDPPTLF